MTKRIEIVISGQVPDEDGDVGHEAIVQCRTGAQAIVQVMADLGLTDIRQARRLYSSKPRPVEPIAECVPPAVHVPRARLVPRTPDEAAE